MVSLLLLGSGIALVAVAVNWYLCFARNLKAAKASGIPYIIVPVFFIQRFWLVTHPIWIRLAKKVLPEKYTQWCEFTRPDWVWEYRYAPFKKLGTDTFLTVSPGGSSLWTADASVINQITTRRNDFPKPTHIYSSVDIYGKNVVSTEGAVWRHHRKSTSPPFTEKNNHLVWVESLDQAQAMVASWVGKDGKGNKTIDRIMDDTMRLSLHVISRAGFGRHLDWPTSESTGQEQKDGYVDPSKIKNYKDDADAGHSMSYTYALHCVLDNILLVMLMPQWILKRAPMPAMRKAYEAFIEWGDYMREMVAMRFRAKQRYQLTATATSAIPEPRRRSETMI